MGYKVLTQTNQKWQMGYSVKTKSSQKCQVGYWGMYTQKAIWQEFYNMRKISSSGPFLRHNN